ncbi:FtsK/SpoIIIE domain-containing protein [Natronomonas gomsonensis]|uniref:FtsK/SpoIIIE domain-containing protein n=1 Tax=Natronomonas gomsonensis TaxID=1046043 RepID=UPI0015C15607|nr:FtsK/SpoIIIE domain-containing protein [Natronomonas gomsonensis]
MSRQFEDALAKWFHTQTSTLDPQPGDRYEAEFPNDETAKNVCEAIIDELASEFTNQEVEYEGVTQSIPTIEVAGTPLHIVLVRASGDDVTESYEVSRWYATTIRNVLAERGRTESNAALLMIYEAGVGIETLDTTHALFTADGQLPLSEFEDRIRSDLSPLNTPGRALIRAIESELNFPDDPMENLEPLRIYCRIYDACANEDGGQLSGLIPELGTYLTETEFNNDWFEKSEDEDNLVSQAEQILDQNSTHAERIQDAMAVTKDTRSELAAYYDEDFINDILSRTDWAAVTRSEAKEGELSSSPEPGEDGGDDGDRGGPIRSGSGGGGREETKEPEFESLDVETDAVNVYGSGSETAGDRSIVATAPGGSFGATITYDVDVSDEPLEFVNSAGERTDGVSVNDDEIHISLSGLDPEAPHYYSLKVYVGHKERRGTPQNQFDIAIVPTWFFDSIGDDTFAVDVENEALIVRNESAIPLDPSRESDADRIVEDIQNESQTITLSRPVLLRPKAPPKVDRLRCQIIESEDTPVPVAIDFLSEIEEANRGEVPLPLSFAAITDSDNWADDGLLVDSAVVTDLDSGEFHSPNGGLIELPETDQRLLQLEELMVNDGTIAPRVTEETGVGTGIPQKDELEHVAADLIDAYTQLFAHFEDRGTIPSTDPWDDETQATVEQVLSTYLRAVERLDQGAAVITFNPYRDLGTIRSSSGDVEYLTPFHPLMLAYGLRLSEWREELVTNGQTEGFRFARFKSVFNPAGFNPYRWSQAADDIFSGLQIGNNHLWAAYAPIEGPGSTTPDYISDVVADKLEAFARAFPLLFTLHEERQLKINLINMGDLGPVIEGLFDFFEFMVDHPELHVPQVTLQIYGDPGDGETLERFFSLDSTDSSLRDSLRSRSHETDIVDLLDRRVTYIHADEQFDEDTRRPAHLTLFRGILKEQSGTMEVDTFPSAVRMDGLLPHDQIEVDSSGGDIVSRSGAAFNGSDDNLLNRVGAAVNALEAGVRDQGFASDRTLSKVITSSDQTNLPRIWDESLWVLHVEPKVDLDFYVRTTSQAGTVSDQTLMIHYSDQYDAASPGFDVITTTDKRDPYLQSLQQVLDDTPGLDDVSPETVLTRLVAIDGELALDIQQATGSSTIELLGLVGGLAVSAELLARELPAYEWIPISLAEFARHDRRYRSDEEGLLQYFGDGKASDDLCFIGVPKDETAENLSLKMWVVETKGGSAGIGKGVDQVIGACEKLTDLFEPDEAYADTSVLRSEFGDVITKIARRLYHYDVLSSERLETVEQHSNALIDGDYTIDLVTDAAGNKGEVIRIQQNIALPELSVRDGVRVLKLPTSVLSLINDPPTGENEIHPDLDTGPLVFDSYNLAPASGSDVESTGTADNDDEGIDSDVDDSSTTDVEPDDSPDDDEESVSPSERAQTGSELGTATDIVQESGSADHSGETGTDGDETEDSEDEIDSVNSETDSDDATKRGEDTESSSTTVEDETDYGQGLDFDWGEADFESLTGSLTQSPDTAITIDISRLTTDLKEQFGSLGVDIHEPNPADVSIGPRKLGVNVRPKSGQKIGGILNALDSISVHLQASGTITGVANPAEGAIRLEIPHGEPRDIYLREAFEQQGETLREPLHIPLGVNTENDHIIVDLLEEHHMLIGGATGSGKSNFLASCICSLAACQPPTRVRLSLLDPKGIDFGRFASLPQIDTYLDDAEDCVGYLRSLLEGELEERRATLREHGAASVQEFNKLAAMQDLEPIPYRVIVIDEFADLIMSLSDNQDEFEDAVGRLAQIGRALGYSILLATQRPDADIVSGSIKTNFNCRVSFELPSNTDSRVILDQPGAEELEGAGDMIALTSAGDEYHLQAYRLLPEDAITVRKQLSGDSGSS